MLNAFSQRVLPPYSGQAQIAESDLARAITMDGELWEIHFVYAANAGQNSGGRSAKRKFRRVAGIRCYVLPSYRAARLTYPKVRQDRSKNIPL